jgi:hypothetical protein
MLKIIGKLNYNSDTTNPNTINGVTVDSLGNIIIYDPNYNPILNPVKYTYPNLIVPEPNNITKPKTSTGLQFVPSGSSSPNYQS